MGPSRDRPGQGYHLGIDLGSTCTAAAVCRAGAPGRPEPVSLGGSATAIATVALLTADGDLLVGEPALRRSASEPHRVARGFTRRIGDGTPLVLGDRTMTADEIAARFVRSVVDLVTAREGAEPDSVAVTHPAGWGAHRRDTLARALAAEGNAGVLLVTEPAAAALGHTGSDGLAPGAVLAVYDLGGDSFDAAVLGGEEDGTPALLGRSVGLDLGGADFDEHALDHVRDVLGSAWDTAWDTLDPADPDALAAVAVLRRSCAAAKEALSADVDAAVPVMLPGTHTRVRIGRADFEDRIRSDVARTVEALRCALAAAGTDPSAPQTVLLVGGSSRIPLVPQLVSAGLGRPVTVDADPRTTGARGAAIAAYRNARPTEHRPELVEIVPEPTGAPRRPAVPHLRTTPPPASPAGRSRLLRVRGALVAALAITGIALAAAGYSLDAALLSGAAPVAPVGSAVPASAAVAGATDAATTDTATADPGADDPTTTGEAEPPADASVPEAAAPARAPSVRSGRVDPTGRSAASPAAPATSAPAPTTPPPTSPPASASATTAPTTTGAGTAGPVDPAPGGSETPTEGGDTDGSATGADTGNPETPTAAP